MKLSSDVKLFKYCKTSFNTNMPECFVSFRAFTVAINDGPIQQ